VPGERFRPRFEAMVAALREHPHITVIDADLPPPLPADRLRALALPDDVRPFYAEMNGFTLEWRHDLDAVREGTDRDTGAIEIVPAEELLRDRKGQIWFDDDPTYRDVKPFDFFAPEACSAFAGKSPNIHYHYLGESLFDTAWQFDDYIDRLLMSRGSWYWILTISRGYGASDDTDAFFRRMPRLFADFDPAMFRPGPDRTIN
jgi:hypothetical protein